MHLLAKFVPRQTQYSTAFGHGPYLYIFRGMVNETMIFETLCGGVVKREEDLEGW
jgi:hypothetical protein